MALSSTPTRSTVIAWYDRWQQIRSEAYQQLIASYTPEQREQSHQPKRGIETSISPIRRMASVPARTPINPNEGYERHSRALSAV